MRTLRGFSVFAYFTVAAFGQAETGPKPIPNSVPANIRNSNQFQRFWSTYSLRSNADNLVPETVVTPAQQVMNQNVLLPPPGSPLVGAPSVNATFKGNRWRNIGPDPMLGGQIGATAPAREMSGRVSVVAIDPNNPNRWLIGASQGGIWETVNSGAAWVARTDGTGSLSMGAIAIAKTNSRIIYAGTGEANNSADSYGGIGLLKSTDGGLNWTLVNNTIGKNGSFSSLWVDPSNANVLLAGINKGVFGRIAFLPPAAITSPVGIFRSTDGGVTFTPVVSGGSGYDIVVNPLNKNQVYAGVSASSGAATDGVYRSMDNGQTFTQLTSTPWHSLGAGVIEMAISPSNPDTIYVSVENRTTGGLIGLFRTNDAWAATPAWTAIPLGATDNGTGTLGYCGWDKAFSSASSQCWYSHEIAVDPVNPNIVYAGGVPLWKYDGTTWTEVSKTVSAPADGIHVDQHSIVFAGSRVVVGNDGGVWSSPDGGNTWANHNTGLATMQFYEGSAYSSGATLRLLGGSQDNGSSTTTGGSWSLVFGGDGAGNFVSPADPLNWVVSSQRLNVARVLNGTYASTNNFDHTSAPFIGKLEGCPHNADTVIIGSRNLARRTDYFSGAAGTAFTNIGNVVTMNSGVSALGYGSNCSTVAAGSRGFSFLVTNNGGATWKNFTSSMPRPASDVAFQPGDDEIVWVTLTAFNQDSPATPGHVLKITNWSSVTPTITLINTGLNMPHNSIVVDPGDPNVIYVGTDLGVLRSTNGGTSWAPMGPGSGMPNVAVHDLKFSGSRLFAFTHGRSAFELVTYDVSGDNVVDCADLTIVRAAFNKRTGNPGFNAAADLNSDGIIDIRDIRMMTSQLTAACSL